LKKEQVAVKSTAGLGMLSTPPPPPFQVLVENECSSVESPSWRSQTGLKLLVKKDSSSIKSPSQLQPPATPSQMRSVKEGRSVVKKIRPRCKTSPPAPEKVALPSRLSSATQPHPHWSVSAKAKAADSHGASPSNIAPTSQSSDCDEKMEAANLDRSSSSTSVARLSRLWQQANEAKLRRMEAASSCSSSPICSPVSAASTPQSIYSDGPVSNKRGFVVLPGFRCACHFSRSCPDGMAATVVAEAEDLMLFSD